MSDKFEDVKEDEFDELDFGDDLDPFAEPPPPNNNREAVERSVKDFSSGFMDELNTENGLEKVSDMAKRSMPTGLKDSFDVVDDLKTEIGNEFSSTSSELKRAAKGFTDTVEGLLPKTNGTESVFNKIRSFIGYEEKESEESKEDLLNKNILAQIAQTMGEQQEKSLIAQGLNANIEEISRKNQLEISATSAGVLRSLHSYTVEKTDTYYRKSLELKYKHLYVARELNSLVARGFDTHKNQLESIVKNTSLPDVVKVRSVEAMEAIARDRFIQNSYDNLITNNDWVKNFKNKLGVKVKDFSTNLALGLSTATDTAEAMKTTGDMGGSKSSMGGSFVADMAKNSIGKRLGNKIASTNIGGKVIDNTNEFMLDPSTYLKNRANTNSKFINSALSGIASFIEDDESAKKIALQTSDPTDAAIYDNRTRESITIVIPKLLSKIESEVRAIRTKTSPDALTYDYRHNMFTKESETVSNFKNTLKNDLGKKGVGEALNKIVQQLETTSEQSLSEEERHKFMSALIKHSMEGKSLLPSGLEESGFYNNLDKKLSNKIDFMFKKANLYGKSQEDRLDNRRDLFDNLQSVKGNITDPNQLLKELKDSGSLESLIKNKIVTMDEDTNTTTMDMDEYAKIISSLVNEITSKSYIDKVNEERKLFGEKEIDEEEVNKIAEKRDEVLNKLSSKLKIKEAKEKIKKHTPNFIKDYEEELNEKRKSLEAWYEEKRREDFVFTEASPEHHNVLAPNSTKQRKSVIDITKEEVSPKVGDETVLNYLAQKKNEFKETLPKDYTESKANMGELVSDGKKNLTSLYDEKTKINYTFGLEGEETKPPIVYSYKRNKDVKDVVNDTKKMYQENKEKMLSWHDENSQEKFKYRAMKDDENMLLGKNPTSYKQHVVFLKSLSDQGEKTVDRLKNWYDGETQKKFAFREEDDARNPLSPNVKERHDLASYVNQAKEKLPEQNIEEIYKNIKDSAKEFISQREPSFIREERERLNSKVTDAKEKWVNDNLKINYSFSTEGNETKIPLTQDNKIEKSLMDLAKEKETFDSEEVRNYLNKLIGKESSFNVINLKNIKKEAHEKYKKLKAKLPNEKKDSLTAVKEEIDTITSKDENPLKKLGVLKSVLNAIEKRTKDNEDKLPERESIGLASKENKHDINYTWKEDTNKHSILEKIIKSKDKLSISEKLTQLKNIVVKEKDANINPPISKELKETAMGGLLANLTSVASKMKEDKENHVEKRTTILENLLEISNELKEKIGVNKKFNDKDGDGKRDGNFRDRLKLFSRKKKELIIKEPEKEKEKRTGLIGFLAPVLGSALGFLKTISSSTVGVIKAITGVAPALAGLIGASLAGALKGGSKLFSKDKAIETPDRETNKKKSPARRYVDAHKKVAKGSVKAGKGLITGVKAGLKGAKFLVKKLPVIGLLAGAGFAINKVIQGDFAGAGLELASGAASMVPGGQILSASIDAYSETRNVDKKEEEEKSWWENLFSDDDEKPEEIKKDETTLNNLNTDNLEYANVLKNLEANFPWIASQLGKPFLIGNLVNTNAPGYNEGTFLASYFKNKNLDLPTNVHGLFNSNYVKKGSIGSVRPGDLIFWQLGNTGKPDHSGIYVGKGWMVHVTPNGVKLEKLYPDDYPKSNVLAIGIVDGSINIKHDQTVNMADFILEKRKETAEQKDKPRPISKQEIPKHPVIKEAAPSKNLFKPSIRLNKASGDTTQTSYGIGRTSKVGKTPKDVEPSKEIRTTSPSISSSSGMSKDVIMSYLEEAEGKHLHKNKKESDVTSPYGIYKAEFPKAKIFDYLQKLGPTGNLRRDMHEINATLDSSPEIRENVKNLAYDFYTKEFMEPRVMKKLTPGENLIFFSNSVNGGMSRGVKSLQSATGADIDGGVGTNTLKKIDEAKKKGKDIKEGMLSYMSNFYNYLITNNPAKYKINERGWNNRLLKLRNLTKSESANLPISPKEEKQDAFSVKGVLPMSQSPLSNIGERQDNEETDYREKVKSIISPTPEPTKEEVTSVSTEMPTVEKPFVSDNKEITTTKPIGNSKDTQEGNRHLIKITEVLHESLSVQNRMLKALEKIEAPTLETVSPMSDPIEETRQFRETKTTPSPVIGLNRNEF